MSLFSLARRLLSVLLPLAITVTVYLYLYPIFHGCAFPLPRNREAGEGEENGNESPLLATLRQHVSTSSSSADAPEPEPAIFRLLVLADPQLEGDSSLPSPDDALLARIHKHWTTIKHAAQRLEEDDNVLAALSAAWSEFVSSDIPRTLRAARKRLDLLGNDYYLAHIYRTLHWWTRPSHVTVLGDLIGSQWVTDEEFERRGRRFWERVFRGGERVGDEVTRTGMEGYNKEIMQEDPGLEVLGAGAADSTWAQKIINIAGNHDIGYSGDASEARLERFERVFGRANWDIRFQHPPIHQDGSNSTITPTLHVVNLNTLTLDSPAFSQDIQSHGYNYVNDLISHRTYPVEDRTTFTLLLTHLPLHKEDGICTDGPYFTYHESDDEDGPEGVPRFRAEGLREQNHLSEHLSTNGVLQGIFGMSGDEDAPVGGRGRNGLILTGHDHTGCDVVHFVEASTDNSSTTEDSRDDDTEKKNEEKESWKWKAKRYTHHHTSNNHNTSHVDTPSIREVTLRSMMGEYGGNAGLLSIWFDARPTVNEWKYEITMCAAGVQHIWWVVHVVDVVTVVVLLVYVVSGGSPPPASTSSSLKLEKVDTKEKGKSQLNWGSAKEPQQKETQTQTQTRQESKTQ